MSELTQAETIRMQLPPHGSWFHGMDSQKLMLEIYHADQGLAVGWDTEHGGKMFGAYPSCMSKEEFMQLLLDVPCMRRNCYELLVDNVPCKAYADIEWEGQQDPDHSILRNLVAAIRAKINEVYSINPLMYVCCGTRPTKENPEIYKHSYHIVCSNLIFERNNDGLMKSLFTSISGFTWMDGVEEKAMIDSRVYTKNRHFRLPHCTKYGSNTPLLRISGDPLLDEFDSNDWGRDVQAVLPFFICNPERDDNSVFVQTPNLPIPAPKAGTNSKRARVSETPEPAKILPVPIQVVQRLLVLAGDTVSILGSTQYLHDEDQWQIQGDQRGKGRKCLVSIDTTHPSNNCLLFIERFQTGFKVHYFCTAKECACHTKKTILGYISMNVETFEWQVALSRPVQPQQDCESALSPRLLSPVVTSDNMQIGDEVGCEGPVSGPQAHDQDTGLDDMSEDELSGITVVDPPIDTKNPALNSYDHVKERYKHRWFKVCHPSQYVVLRPTGQYSMFKCDSYFRSAPDIRTVYYYVATNNPENPFVRKKFVDAWLADDDIHLCEGVVVDPTLPQGAGFHLNIWTGFAAAKLPPVPDDDVLTLVEPLLNHILRVYANNNAEHAYYISRWFANPFQTPHTPTGVAILLYGKEGCGKGIISTFHRLHVLGLECSSHTQDTEKELFSTHADGLVNKVFIQADEVIVNQHDRRESLKNVITNETITYEPKYGARMTLKNMVNLFMTTNNENAISISPTCRRYALFRCSNVYKGNIKYFTDLGKHLLRPEVARAWYQYLKTLDMGRYESSIHFQEYRPRTEYLREAQQATISCVSRFLSGLINKQDQESSGDPSTSPLVIKNGSMEITATLMYQKYQEFHVKGNYKFMKTQTSFGREIKPIDGVAKHRSTIGYHYKLDLDKIKQHLIETNEYDEEVMLDA
jgi:hypothetical protein